MRATVTLDPDVDRLLRGAMRERGISFKQALNGAVRAGLAPGRRQRRRRFVQKTYSLGPVQNFRWEKALSVAQAMEDEEITRKLSLRQ